MDGSGGAALSVLCAVVALGLRTMIRLDRQDRRRVASANRAASRTATSAPRPRRSEPTVRPLPQIRVALAQPEPQDERPELIEVPQRQFVRAARLVAGSQYASALMLQRRLLIDAPTAERLMLAIEGAGIIGPPQQAGARRVLVMLDGLGAVFARFGIVEDEIPAGFE